MAEKLTAQFVGGTGGTVEKVTEIVLSADNWYGGNGLWSQIVEVEEASPFSKIDLQPSADLLSALHSTALMAENNDGRVTVYAVGEKPASELIVQATITEVVRV